MSHGGTGNLSAKNKVYHGGTVQDHIAGQSYLNSLEPWRGKGDFTLDGIKSVLAWLENPQDRVPAIHITGTNGKGSVSAMVAAVLEAKGLRVGLSTSPHLGRVNERISINGEPISDSLLGRMALRLKEASEKTGKILSYHEALTALSFLVFANERLDWMVVEVGLGGRLDASNVITAPRVSVITSIGRDHEAILGSELEKIAVEKAGIIKATGEVVVGEIAAHLVSLVESKRQVKLFARDFEALRNDDGSIVHRSKNSPKELIIQAPGLKGEYQLSNIAVAIEAARVIGAGDKEICTGIAQVKWPGRLEELVFGSSTITLDGAHNIDAIAALLQTYKHNKINKLAVVFGVLGSKRWREMIDQMLPFVSEWYLVEPDSEMAVPVDQVAHYLSCFEVNAHLFSEDVSAALRAATKIHQRVLVCGSLYLVGAARSVILKSNSPKV